MIFQIDILSHHDLQGDRHKRGLERVFVDLGEESGRGPSVQIPGGVLQRVDRRQRQRFKQRQIQIPRGVLQRMGRRQSQRQRQRFKQ